MDSIKEEPMSINDGTALATITTSTNEKEPEKVSVALKLTQEAANNVRSVMQTISELLSITLPSNWDLGTLSLTNQLLNDVPKMSLNLNPANQQQQQSQTLDSK
jgi:hypothetical protein